MYIGEVCQTVFLLHMAGNMYFTRFFNTVDPDLGLHSLLRSFVGFNKKPESFAILGRRLIHARVWSTCQVIYRGYFTFFG